MRKAWSLPVLGLVIVGGAYAATGAAKAPPAGPKVDKDAIAERLVATCTGVHEDDVIVVSGGSDDLELLENIAVQVRKRGASPLLTFGSDRLTRRMYDDVPASYDTKLPRWSMKLAETATGWISVDYGDDPGLLAHVSPQRFADRNKAFQPINELMLKRNLRQVNLGNGLYPTASLAKQFGITKEQLSGIFWSGVNTDYSKLQSTGGAVKKALVGGRKVRVTNANGTDVTFGIEGRRVFVSDGVISPEDMKEGGAACQVWLPAGEVYVTAVPGTAEGKVVVDRHFYQDKEILGLELTFKGGKLASMSAKSGIEPLQALYDASGEGKDEFAGIDFGINSNVAIPAGSRMVAWVPAGMVTVGFGNNVWAGGSNNASFGLFGFIPGSTVEVDGKAVVKKGVLENSLLASE
jgi:aminopeptidase